MLALEPRRAAFPCLTRVGPETRKVATQHALDVDLADALQRTGEEGVDGHKFARVVDVEVSLAVLGVEALQRLDLLLTQLDLPLPTVSASRSSRWCRVCRSPKDPHPARTGWTSLSISSSATRWAPWVGWSSVCASMAFSTGTPSRRCRVPGRVVARTASGGLSSLLRRWSFSFSFPWVVSRLKHFSSNLREAGLAIVLSCRPRSGDYCTTTTGSLLPFTHNLLDASE